MTRLQPLGSKLIVLPVKNEEPNVTSAGIETVEMELSVATVVEVGTDVADIFKKGDRVIFPKTRGTSKLYQGKPHLFLDGMPPNEGGDVWAKEVIEIISKDKGESL